MAIIRSNSYLSMPRELFENPKLSLASRGLMGFIKCYPDVWGFNSSTLCKDVNCDEEEVRKLLDELIEAGYLEESEPE